MSVKNSAGVKFNDATELIIQADPDGTVESVFNKSNNTEYVGGGGGDFTTCKMTVVGEQPVSLTLPFIDEGDYIGVPAIIADGESFHAGEYTIPLYKGSASGEVAELLYELVVTGNAEIDDDNIIIVTGDFTIEAVDGNA